MENPRPQLSQIELQQLRWFLGGLIGVVSAWTVFYMEVDAMLALAVITPTVPFFTLFPRFSRALPALFHRLAFPLIVTVFALDLWGNREPLPAMIRLDLMLLGYRCIAPRGRREDLQLILLALFVVVVTGVFTVSPAFVVQILFFTGAALALLLAVTLSDARAGGVAGNAAGWDHVRWPDLFRRLRAAADLRVVALGGALFCGVVALSALLFLALPRFEITNDFFIDRLITKSSRTGFSENILFGEVNKIAQDGGMAFAVDVSDPAAVPANLYWRMLVLDEYSGQGFRASAGLRNSFPPARDKAVVHGGAGRAREDRTVWTIYYQPGVSRYLPLMGGFGRLHFNEPQALAQSPALRIAALPSEPAKMVGYRVEGMDTDGVLRDRLFAREHILPAWDSPRARIFFNQDAPPRETNGDEPASLREGETAEPTFLELNGVAPGDLEKLRAWVAEIGGAGEDGPDYARRAGAWLQARHTYSLDSTTPAGDGDVIVRWMGSREPGHCELFAGSMVLLARAAGHPTRLVTGFKGGVWNPTSGSITVRNSDAHAWCEIWDEANGSWVRTDATPGGQITPANVPGGLAAGASRMEQDTGWSARLDGLRVFWYRRIVSFDQNSQLELVRGTKDQLRTMLLGLRGLLETRVRELLEWLRQPWDFPRIFGSAAALAAVVGGVWFWCNSGRAWWMAWRSRRAASHRHDPVRREASRWLARLERRARAPGAATAPGLGATRERLLRLRYGAREGWAPPAEVFAEAKRRLHEMARGGR
jgi:hypothetical protein